MPRPLPRQPDGAHCPPCGHDCNASCRPDGSCCCHARRQDHNSCGPDAEGESQHGDLGELDKLPQVGEARAKQIIELRTKGKFKGWADFESRATGTSLNKTALDALKDKVTF